VNLRSIEAFVWIARLGSFRGAAAQLSTTQPAISLRLQELERELGSRLIDRTRGRITLTAEGRECIDLAERMLSLSEELGGIRFAGQPARRRVALGVSELIAHTWLPDLVHRIAVAHPSLTLDVTIETTPTLLAGLALGNFDIVLAGAHRFATTFHSVDLGSEPFAWVTHPDHDAAAAGTQSPRDLENRTIITWGKAAAIYPAIDAWFAAAGAYPRRRITCNSSATIARLVKERLGIGLLPPSLIVDELENGRLRVVQTEPAFASVIYKAVYAAGPLSLGATIATEARSVSTFGR
jgi:DNA-binding transcriptional LysR family regulator